jgi:hypothetical protein
MKPRCSIGQIWNIISHNQAQVTKGSAKRSVWKSDTATFPIDTDIPCSESVDVIDQPSHDGGHVVFGAESPAVAQTPGKPDLHILSFPRRGNVDRLRQVKEIIPPDLRNLGHINHFIGFYSYIQ